MHEQKVLSLYFLSFFFTLPASIFCKPDFTKAWKFNKILTTSENVPVSLHISTSTKSMLTVITLKMGQHHPLSPLSSENLLIACCSR